MNRCGPLLLSAAVAASPAPAGDAGAAGLVVRQDARPSEAVIGQRVTVTVEVLFPDDMPAPPRVRLPEVPGAQVFRFESQGTTVRDQLDGRPYVGQRFEFALFPRRGGRFTVPPASVTLLDRRQDVVGSADGQETSFRVGVPPGVDASKPVVATARLTLEQRWDPEPATAFQVGAALRRTIVREAEDVPALALQDLHASTPEGVRAYADAPDAEDRGSRGTVTGRRVDRITYVFERPETFALPALGQPWWDLGTGTLREANAAGLQVRVRAAPAAGSGQATPAASGGQVWAPMLPDWPCSACSSGWPGARCATWRRPSAPGSSAGDGRSPRSFAASGVPVATPTPARPMPPCADGSPGSGRSWE